MKKILIIILSLMPVLLSANGIYNKGATMFLKGAVFMKAVNLDVKNDNSGVLSIREASTLKVQNGDVINESGTVNMIGTSTLEVTENLINKGNFNNESSSSTIVKKNVVNSGGIYNESIIEIGE